MSVQDAPTTEQQPLFVEAPSPADMPQQSQAPDGDALDGNDSGDEDKDLLHVRKIRKENQSLRDRLREAEASAGESESARRAQRLEQENKSLLQRLQDAEPILKQHQQQVEANKTELQKAQEALQTRNQEYADLQVGYTRLELAALHNIPPDDIDLIGSGSREDMEARAARLGALYATTTKTPAPPSDRPVEGLRPGANPEPPKSVDNSYPANWGFQPPQRQS